MEVATSSVLVLPFTASSVGVARRRLIGDLTEAGVYEGTACDAGLVISELISNALVHARPLPGRTVKVSWTLGQDSVEVAVSDAGAPTVPMVSEPTNWSLGGRGLGIVARLSVRWGVCVSAGRGDGDPDLDGSACDASAHDGRADGDGSDGGADGGRPGQGGGGETTVWAEVPVRYGSAASLVIASSRDA